jgi:hypothetical protein
VLKTTVARQDFLKKLECAAPGLSAGGMIQQSDSYIFQNGFLITFNGDLSCRLKSGLPKDFAGAVKAKKLLEAVREFKAEELNLSVSEGKFRAASNGEWVKVYMDEKVSLPLQEIERPGVWKPLHTDFCEGLDGRNPALDHVRTRPPGLRGGHGQRPGRPVRRQDARGRPHDGQAGQHEEGHPDGGDRVQ